MATNIRRTKKYRQWRRIIYKRDRYTCQRCGTKTRRKHRLGTFCWNLHAHHIQPIATHPELVFEISNGVTLCQGCHVEVHKERGREWF